MAGRAVDGNTDQDLSDGSCAHPDSKNDTVPAAVRGSRGWWSVDLSAGDSSRTYVIRKVTIYFRKAYPGNMYLSNGNTYILMVLSTIK